MTSVGAVNFDSDSSFGAMNFDNDSSHGAMKFDNVSFDNDSSLGMMNFDSDSSLVAVNFDNDSSHGTMTFFRRNDPISTVREAAELALSKMNVPEAQRCIKVTQILSTEMSALKPRE